MRPLAVALLILAAACQPEGEKLCCGSRSYALPYSSRGEFDKALASHKLELSIAAPKDGNGAFALKTPICGIGGSSAYVNVEHERGRMLLRLNFIRYSCPGISEDCHYDCGNPEDREALKAFEREVVAKLGGHLIRYVPAPRRTSRHR